MAVSIGSIVGWKGAKLQRCTECHELVSYCCSACSTALLGSSPSTQCVANGRGTVSPSHASPIIAPILKWRTSSYHRRRSRGLRKAAGGLEGAAKGEAGAEEVARVRLWAGGVEPGIGGGPAAPLRAVGSLPLPLSGALQELLNFSERCEQRPVRCEQWCVVSGGMVQMGSEGVHAALRALRHLIL